MIARLYANERFPLPVVQELRKAGHDVVTIQETGYANQAMTDTATPAARARLLPADVVLRGGCGSLD